jgi:phosphonate transport system ATP-binding protein
VFSVRQATVRFAGTTALDAVSLEVEAGEVVGLIGPSGAGKTTLLRLLNGTQRPDEGEVVVEGRALTERGESDLRALRARIGFIPQSFDLVPNLRVSQNVLLARLGRGGWLTGMRALLWPAQDDLEQVHQTLQRVGIGDRIFQRTDTLSGGEQQRVAIARALHQQPVALLADEPVASVDPARAREVVGLLVDLARERGVALVVSLHDLPLARTLPRLVGLRDGSVVFDAPSTQLEDAAFAELYERAS